MRKAVLAALVVVVLGLFGASPSSAQGQPNEQVCPQGGVWSSHMSADNQTSFTYTAPEGFAVAEVCVKAGSAQQGNGPHFISYDPPQVQVTFRHPSGKEISHFSVRLVPNVTTTTGSSTTTTLGTTTTTEQGVTTTTTTVEDTTTTSEPVIDSATSIVNNPCDDSANLFCDPDEPRTELARTGIAASVGWFLLAVALVGFGVFIVLLARNQRANVDTDSVI